MVRVSDDAMNTVVSLQVVSLLHKVDSLQPSFCIKQFKTI